MTNPTAAPAADTTNADDGAAKAAAAAAAAELGGEGGDDTSLDIDSQPQKVKTAPKADPKPEAKADDEEGKAVNEAALQEGITYEYNPTGDASLDVALNYVGSLGFSASNPAVVAATKGDFKPLEAALQALGDKAKGHKSFLTLAQEAYTRKTEASKAKAAEAEAIVHNAVGGKEVWAKVRDFVAANADDTEKQHINEAFNKGGMTAAAVARTLLEAYQRKSGEAKSVVKPGAAAASSGSGAGALSPREYAREVSKLAAKTRGSIDSLPEYAALRQRASAYRG